MTIDKIGSQTIAPSNIHLNVQTPDRSTITLNSLQAANKQKLEGYGEPKRETVQEAADKVNAFLEPVRRNLKFELHDKLDKYYVTVVDSETSEVIKEIPPKKFLDMYASMAEFMGLLVDSKI